MFPWKAPSRRARGSWGELDQAVPSLPQKRGCGSVGEWVCAREPGAHGGQNLALKNAQLARIHKALHVAHKKLLARDRQGLAKFLAMVAFCFVRMNFAVLVLTHFRWQRELITDDQGRAQAYGCPAGSCGRLCIELQKNL